MAEVPKQLTPITSENAKELGAKGGKAKKGSIHLSTRIKNMLDDPDFEMKLKDGSILKGEPIVAIMKVAIARAASGDIRFLEWLAKYGYGSSVNLNVTENPIQTIIDKFGSSEGVDEVPPITADEKPTSEELS